MRTWATVLLDQLRELLAAVESGRAPAGPAYRHLVEGRRHHSAVVDRFVEASARFL